MATAYRPRSSTANRRSRGTSSSTTFGRTDEVATTAWTISASYVEPTTPLKPTRPDVENSGSLRFFSELELCRNACVDGREELLAGRLGDDKDGLAVTQQDAGHILSRSSLTETSLISGVFRLTICVR
jgi:hypothetical protein